MIRPNRTVFLALVIGLLLATFWIRITNLYDAPLALHRDEAQNLHRAWRMINDLGHPLFFGDNPEPFDAIVRAPYYALVGVMPFTGRLFSTFLQVIAVAATIAVARALFWRHPARDWIALIAGLALAVNPSFAVMGRGVYRTSWVPAMSMLATLALARGWHSRKTRDYALFGLFTGLTGLFYLAGLVFPLALGLVLLHRGLVARRWWPDWKKLLLAGGVALLVMLPWLTLFFTVEGWLNRVDQAGAHQIIFDDPMEFITDNVGEALAQIYSAGLDYDPRWNTDTTAFLNPALLVLLVLGLLASLRYWRRTAYLLPLLLGLVFTLPAILSSGATQPVRITGLFAPLALLAGLGAGTLIQLMRRWALLGRMAALALLAVLIVSPIYTHWHVQYHFTQQPRLLDDPTFWSSMANWYQIGTSDILRYAASREHPTYVPMTYVDNLQGVVWLRARRYPHMDVYAGEDLPPGEVIVPIGAENFDKYGIRPTADPVQYALLLPDEDRILMLPPLPEPDAYDLIGQVEGEGQLFSNDEGWPLAHTLMIDAAANPFDAVLAYDGDPDAPALGVFDDVLELVDVHMPRQITPGQIVPVVSYWRMNQPIRNDYLIWMQIWATGQDASYGTMQSSYNYLYRYALPTWNWQPGQIVPVLRYVPMVDALPEGGYRLMVSAFSPPDLDAAAVSSATQRVTGEWLEAAYPVVPLADAAAEPGPDAQAVDVLIGDAVRLTHIALDPPLAELGPGDEVTVSLYWSVEQPPRFDATLFVHLLDADDTPVAQQDALPFDGRYPTLNWGADERIRTQHRLTLPADGPLPVTVQVGMYTQPDIVRLPLLVDGQRAEADVVRLTIR